MGGKIVRPWVEEARQLRAQGMSYERIAKKIGVGDKAVRLQLNPKFAESQRERKREENQFRRSGVVAGVRLSIPPEVLRERDEALSHVPTLTAALFGDPPPSRSALAQRG